MLGLRPFFCYYGGKWRSAPRYPRPRYERILEPFAGAAGYSTRYPDRKILLVEKDPVVAALWEWLISAKESEILSLPLEVPTTVRDLGLAPGPAALIGFWLNKGASRPMQSPSAWMRGGTSPASWWGREIRDRIASQVSAIRHWTIVHGSWTDVLQDEATYYIDPPYQRAGRHYRESAIDYPALGAWCRGLRGQVIVCEEEGADWLPFKPFLRAKANQSRHGGKVCREAIWYRES